MTKKRLIAARPSEHPDHSKELVRLKRIKGQIEGLERMIEDRRYCPDILMQAKAAGAALKAFQGAVLQTHLRGCVRSAMKSTETMVAENKIQEILDLLQK